MDDQERIAQLEAALKFTRRAVNAKILYFGYREAILQAVDAVLAGGEFKEPVLPKLEEVKL